MSYLALYRKYRPKTFDEVVGQESIIKILKNQIKYDRIGHAYLFSGIRGTGKTSLAKVFAKAVNCPHNHDGNPCNVCEVCTKLDSSGVMDIIEIDGASNRGVDEIREIREKVKYPPVIGRYKVYIIDEVHMLTKEAFNALLKTLEEPPEHIIFILATTEPQKCPNTILSRCQRFEIRPISTRLIVDQLKKISDDLRLTISEESLFFVAERGEQSMRDALSIMDQIIDLKDEKGIIQYSDLLDFLGMAAQDRINELVGNILKRNPEEVIKNLRDLEDGGKESALIMEQLIKTLRDLLIIKTTGQLRNKILKTDEKTLSAFDTLAQAADFNLFVNMIDFLIQEKNKLKYNSLQNLILEIACLKLCEFEATPKAVAEKNEFSEFSKSKTAISPGVRVYPIESRQAKPNTLSGKEQTDSGLGESDKEKVIVPVTEDKELAKNENQDEKVKSVSGKKLFDKLCKQIGPAQCMFLKKAHPDYDGQVFTIAFSEEDRNYISFINTPERIADFEKILKDETSQDIKVIVTVEKEDFSELDLAEKTRRIINDPAIEIIGD
ncbi:DNA polymerase III subunit gamma/tau [Eubacteriaceae bacterium ES3]|nr:DNA polymerase III subunit gamma/tau [Eubacteriaceae bacterium ES3]